MNGRANRWLGLRAVCIGVSAAVGFYALYFAKLGAYPLMDPDEPIYGQVAKQMATGTGWLTPHYGGSMWFDKPPFFYWLSALCAKALGPTELAYRLPSAIMALALVLLVYALASYDFGRRIGVLSSLVMGTCLQQVVLARAAVTDMTLVVFLTAALYAYRRWLDSLGRGRFGWMILCGAMTGLGMLTKGPVAPVLLSVTFVIHLWWIGRLKRLRNPDALVGIASALTVGLPWFVAMYVLHRGAFVQGFLVANNLTRFLKAEHAEQTGQWYSYFVNLPILFAFFFPWSVFLPGAIRRGWRSNHGTKLAAVWIGVVFVFFSLSKTILVTYIFPLYPAAAVFVGAFLQHAASKDTDARRGAKVALWVAFGVSGLLLASLVLSARAKYPEAEFAAAVLGGILVMSAIGALAWVRFRSWDIPTAAWIVGAGMAVFALWLVTAVVPGVESRGSTRDLAACIPDTARARVATFGLNKTDSLGGASGVLTKPSLLYYVGSRLIDAGDVPAARRLLSGEEPVYIICRQGAEESIKAPGSVVLLKSGDLEVLANAAGASLKGFKEVVR